MSKIKELKTSEDSSINLVDIVELFSPQKKSKYTELLLKMMKATPNLKEHSNEIVSTLTREFDFITKEELDKYSPIQLMWIYKFIDTFFNFADLKKFNKFCEYNERGLIEQNDLTRYKDYDAILHQLEIAENKVVEKEMESQVIKVHDDAEWLLVRPLSFNASKKYGANTKWCTTTEHNPEYFNKYSKRGVLIYCISKVKKYKVAAFYSLDKNEPEFSWWNEKDARIDSLETELPTTLRELIGTLVKDKATKSNQALSESGEGKAKPKSKALSSRVENAVRRASDELNETEVAEDAPEAPRSGAYYDGDMAQSPGF